MGLLWWQIPIFSLIEKKWKCSCHFMWTVISNVKMIIWRSFVTSCYFPWKCYIRQLRPNACGACGSIFYSTCHPSANWQLHTIKCDRSWEQYVLFSLIVEGSGHWPELDSGGGMGGGGSRSISVSGCPALVGGGVGGRSKSGMKGNDCCSHLWWVSDRREGGYWGIWETSAVVAGN